MLLQEGLCFLPQGNESPSPAGSPAPNTHQGAPEKEPTGWKAGSEELADQLCFDWVSSEPAS